MMQSQGFLIVTFLLFLSRFLFSQNKNVAVLFNWDSLERQVVIEGVADKIKTSESMNYFLSRPRGSQLGAWVSNQSSVLSSREFLELKLENLNQK